MKHSSSAAHLLLAACAAALGSPHASAEPVPDPTRPATALLGDPAEARPAKAARSVAPAASAVPAAARLQSVQLGAAGAASALLDGRLVHLGDRVGDRYVAAIDRHGLTLRGPNGEQRLSLLTTGITQAASRVAPPATDTLATGTSQEDKP
jgi:hypothetical protein